MAVSNFRWKNTDQSQISRVRKWCLITSRSSVQIRPPPLKPHNASCELFYCANACLSKPADFGDERFCTGFVLARTGFQVRFCQSHPGCRTKTRNLFARRVTCEVNRLGVIRSIVDGTAARQAVQSLAHVGLNSYF